MEVGNFHGRDCFRMAAGKLAQPVAITANTVYVASYHATAGPLQRQLELFATAGVNNAPLHALATTSAPGRRFA